MPNEPLVSIGVPVYNDGLWLRNSLDHLIGQDYRNLEIILADDVSNDDSRRICHEYGQRDARIHLYENKHNLGALGNHKFVFDVSTGDYFAWGSGHDYFHPSFISRTLEKLQANPSEVMCCSQSVFVNEKGEITRTTKGGLDMNGMPPTERFGTLLKHTISGGTANIFYGLYRQEALAQMNLLRKVDGSDVIMLGELSLLGEITEIDEVLHYRIINKIESGKERSERHARDVSDGGPDLAMPHFYASSEFLSISENDRLSANERQNVYQKVVELDVNIGRRAIADEIEHFISYSRRELASLEAYPQVRKYRATKVLSVLQRAWMLGFEIEGLHLVRSICLSILGLG